MRDTVQHVHDLLHIIITTVLLMSTSVPISLEDVFRQQCMLQLVIREVISDFARNWLLVIINVQPWGHLIIRLGTFMFFIRKYLLS